MFRGILILVAAVFAISGYGQEIEVIKGHAHNDYENENPLFDAINNGFISVEADVHLIDDHLYVSHDRPKELDPALTLETLYLDPLKDHILKNKGFIYPEYSGPFYLMIDFKSTAKPTYEKLKEILSDYLSILSVMQNGKEQKGPVKILISGNRPVKEIIDDESKLAGIDGRPNDLEDHIPTSIMPVISDNYSKFLSWDGHGEVNNKEFQRLKELVRQTHAQDKILRLWNLPDHETVWKFLLDNGVDLINTDHIEDFREFVLKYDYSGN